MAIIIKGTIAGLTVDLTVDGLDHQWLANLVAAAKVNIEAGNHSVEPSPTASNTVPTPTPTPTPTNPNPTAMQLALALITKKGEMLSCDLINALDEQGISEIEIKKTLLFLREREDIFTARSRDGNQRIYSKKE